ncbi:PIN/TRAM domain-containing protein [Thalassoroseus pseudoceratinae]|uniref:PIN/TRAM domain-containing protein n=1 Tax=Thalassoroseus pseudoceratinae TaxID=2713176 RepID=UPI001422E67A|nr:PIN domain-containing protein [Thalassoroseus pseudoceratinae]
MLLLFVRIVFLLACAGAIATYISQGAPHPIISARPFIWFLVLLAITQLATLIDLLIPRKDIKIISSVYFGLIIGFILSVLLMQALAPLLGGDARAEGLVTMLATLMIPYVCVTLLLQTRDNFRFVIPYVEFSRELKGGKPLILDSSALIDGRIADVMDTKILDSQLVVPDFILHEIQEIADSNDKQRRTRGRRGLDVLSKLQNSPHVDVKMLDAHESGDATGPVDQRLIALSKQNGGRVVTNDYNLNKVANLQGVDVINLNDLSNALKPRYIPGERLQIKVIKEGESVGQGVGYLDDGTMVVCENAANMVGKEIGVIVTSVLQSSAGRMIFGRQVHSVDHS